jgi:large repetitive protein
MKRLLFYIFIFLVLPARMGFGQAQINFENGYVVNNGAYLVVNNSNPNALVQGNGYIIPEGEFSMLIWGIGTATGTYVVPFGDSTLKYLPVTLNINAAGTGNGEIKFSTYHTPALNSLAQPSDVTNMTPFILPGSPSNTDNSYNVVDRFYIIDADSGYYTKPSVGNIIFPYVSGTAQTEVGSPNTLTESHLMAQRFNSSLNTWSDWFGEGCTDAISNNVGTVQTGSVSPANFYRSWSLWDNLTPLPVQITGTNPTCNSASSGSATVTVYGGISPYTYSWVPSGGSAATANGLSAGTYTVSVNDVNGCTSTISITLTQPTAITVTPVVTANVTCNGNSTGSASVSAIGGTGTYTYLWSPGGGTNTSESGLSAGTYSIQATDGNGCTGSATIAITQPAPLTAGAGPINNVSCNGGNNGRATVTAVNGTTPYTYSWINSSFIVISTAQSTPAILSAGSYTVTVTDSCGASVTAVATITQPNPIRDSISSVTEVGCNGGNGGSLTVGVKGGTFPFSYLWAPGGSTLKTASGLSAGTYTVSITDANGCTSSVTGTITQPGIVRDSLASVTYPACNGGTGSATLGVSGGTSPYTYTWIRGISTTATATGLTAGTYTVTVKDNHGCSGTTVSITITQPGALRDSIVKASTVNVTCNGGNNGKATVGVKYGTSPYTYLWTPTGETTATATGLSAGTYSVSVTDNHGCSTSATVTITQPAAIRDSIISVGNEICYGSSSGVASVGVKYGASPYTYLWTPSNKTTAVVTGLSAGTYSVNITDKNGCTGTTTVVTITQPNEIRDSIVNAATINVSCNGGNNGSATVGVQYGVAPFTYKWQPGGQTTATITGLSAGTYSVTVSDKNGCTGTTSTVTITQQGAVRDSIVRASVTNVSCNGGNNGSATAGVKYGTSPYTYLWTPTGETTATATGLSAGTYSLSVTDNNGCSGTTTTVTITQPTAVRDSVSALSNIVCNGGDGSATIGVKGGVSPYTYAWAPNGKTTATVTNLTAGSYTVTVKDKNGCSNTLLVAITQPAAIRDSLARLTEPTCNGNYGSAVVGVKGGTGPYTYTWNPNVSNTDSATGLTLGSYTVTVSDNHGCSKTLSLTITQPGDLRDSIVASQSGSINCKGYNTGYITLGVKGGVTPYTYTWTPNVSTTNSATNLSAGTYSVTVTDNHGCTGGTATYTVTQPLYILTDSISVLVNVGCFGGNGGEISIGTRGGTQPYTYHWSNGKTTYTISGLSAGTYTTSITDNHGCSNTISVTVTQPAAALSVTLASLTDPVCHGGTGTATVNVTGGTPVYTYAWTPNVSTTSSATVTAGNYTVTVSDANGCNASLKIVVTQPNAIRDTMIAADKQNVSCRGAGNGAATVGVKYGTTPYTYSWSNGATTATASGLSAGTYTVTITDANGCTGTAATTTITAPAAALKDSIASEKCVSNLVTATIGVTGGTAPYTYLWNPGGGTKQTMTGLAPGSYTITVTDNHGCTNTFGKSLVCGGIVKNDGAIDDSGDTSKTTCCAGLDNINLYPNPNTGQFSLMGVDKGMIIEVYNYTGRKLSTITATENPMLINIADQPNGVYLIRILDKNGNTVAQKKVVKTY